MTSLNTFLPSDARPSYESLFRAYGKWWQAQPSISAYPRYYDTDGEHYLIVWEGAPGFYDHYGDAADDNHFYNNVVKGPMIFFRISKSQPVEISVYQNFDLAHRWRYNTSAEMRAGMLSDWIQIQPTLGEQGEALKRFIDDNADRMMGLLNDYGQLWAEVEGHTQRHCLAYHVDRDMYLCLWQGDADAVCPGVILNPDPGLIALMMPKPNWDQIRAYVQYQTSPRIHWKGIKRYAEARISFMRLPVRFEVFSRIITSETYNFYRRFIHPDQQRLESFQALANLRS